MKKKIIAAGVACALALGSLSAVGCSSSNGSAEAPSEGAGAETQEATQSEPAAPESDYAVTIDGCEVTQDYQGAPAIVVTYTWTNNSDKATSFMVAIDAQAFQNGVELDYGIVSNYDTNSTLNDVQPGSTQTVQKAYTLNDQSDVSVQCTELISFDDTPLATASFSVA